jgi:ribonuclease VapC
VIVDSSALVAIVMAEPGSEALLTKIISAAVRGIGAPTLLETLMVLTKRLQGEPWVLLQALLREMDVEVLPFTEEHCLVALSAFLRFGKGRHRAALNFGDCAAYAVASLAGEPLLFVGADFTKTDIVAA